MNNDNSYQVIGQNITLKDRKKLEVTGIKKIESLNKEEFLIDTKQGLLFVKGTNLEMQQLDTEKGNLWISGTVNLIEYIKSMMESGVNSFKVEGRMRGIYYIATVILAYRRMIDKIKAYELTEAESKYYLAILNRCANRESTPQFVNALPGKEEQYFLGRDEISNQDFLGIVLSYDEQTKEAVIEQRNYFKVGDVVEFFGPNHETFTYNVDKILNENNEEIEIANHPRMIVKLKIDINLHKYDMMRIKVFDKHNFL